MRVVEISLQFVRLLALVLWIGGIAFFAFAVAPVAFGSLPSAHEAGLVVAGTLRVLHLLGLTCGMIFLLLTFVRLRRSAGSGRLWTECALVLAMMGVTASSQFVLLPAMDSFRARAGGDIGRAGASDPAQLSFERLHRWSEQMEGAVLLGGVALLLAVAGEGGRLPDGRIIRL